MNALIPLTLAFMMFSLGASVKIEDFKQAFSQPRAIATGLLLQIVALPVIAFGFAAVVVHFKLNNAEILITGLFLIAVAPGGVTSNIVSHLTKGDPALSVSMTAISSILFPFILPVTFNLLLSSASSFEWVEHTSNSNKLPVISSIAKLLTISLFPMALGMLLASTVKFFNKENTRKMLSKLSNVAFLIMVIVLIKVNYKSLPPLFSAEVLIIISLASVAFFIGWQSAKALGLNIKQRQTLAIETSLQNAGTAILVATLLLQQTQLANIALMYGVLTAGVSLLAIVYFQFLKTKRLKADIKA